MSDQKSMTCAQRIPKRELKCAPKFCRFPKIDSRFSNCNLRNTRSAQFNRKKTPFLVTTTKIIAHSIKKSVRLAIQDPPFKTEHVEVKMAWLRQFDNQSHHGWLRKLIRQAANSL